MFLMALALASAGLPAQPMQAQLIRDPITDQLRAYAVLREDGNTLVVSCRGGEPDDPLVSLHSRHWFKPGFFLSGDRAITYRFDDQPPRRSMWDINGRQAALTSDSRVAHFLQGLAGAERLVIRARDVENRRIDLYFQVRNAAPAIRQALAACAAAPERD